MAKKSPDLLPLLFFLFTITLAVTVSWAAYNTPKILPRAILQTAAASGTPLSLAQYDAERDKLLNIAKEKDPAVALATLAKDISDVRGIAQQCHPIAHMIGRSAYAKYGNFGVAMQYQNEICNSGYMHGIIEAFLNGTGNMFASAAVKLCDAYPTGTLTAWECNHGLGHGFMFVTKNDVPKSISLCRLLHGKSEADACVTGVFMENFGTDPDGTDHVTKYENPSDPMYPCPIQNTDNKGACYLYSVGYFMTLSHNDYQRALAWCPTTESDYVATCMVGVGSKAIVDFINDPRSAETICDAAPDGMTSACILGIVEAYNNQYRSLGSMESLCAKMNGSDQPACSAAMATVKEFYPNSVL